MQIGIRCNRFLARDFASCRPTFKLFHICAGARRVSSNKCDASSDRDMVSNDIKKAAIVWIRSDIRLADHAPLVSACSLPQTCFVLPVYCLSPALLQPRCNIPGLNGIPVLGPHRGRWDNIYQKPPTSLCLFLQQCIMQCGRRPDVACNTGFSSKPCRLYSSSLLHAARSCILLSADQRKKYLHWSEVWLGRSPMLICTTTSKSDGKQLRKKTPWLMPSTPLARSHS